MVVCKPYVIVAKTPKVGYVNDEEDSRSVF